MLATCGQERPDVRSYLGGDVRLRTDVDSTSTDQSGFEVLVADREGGRLDTLGFAVTDRSGVFEMVITAPERGGRSVTDKPRNALAKAAAVP